MKTVTFIRVLCAVVMTLLMVGKTGADTTKARCDVHPNGEDRVSASLPCRFSQRQGFVSIAREDGVSYDLSPTDDAPGNYVDAAGRAAYRQRGLGKAGLIFRMADETVYVYWDALSLKPLGAARDNPAAP